MTPAAIVLLGDRLDSLDVRRLVRRMLGRPEPVRKPVEQMFWYRSTKFVMRRAIPIGLAVVALLLLLGAPFLGIKWGFPDDRVLPQSASARQVGDELRNDFAVDSATQRHRRHARRRRADPGRPRPATPPSCRRCPTCRRCRRPAAPSSAAGTAGPPSAATGFKDGSAFLTVGSTAPLFSDASETQLDRLRAVRHARRPAGAADRRRADQPRQRRDAITSRLPLVLGIIAAITFVLLFLLTGSVVCR